jgi:hypothetical protein
MAASPYNATALTPTAPTSKLNGIATPTFAARTFSAAQNNALNALGVQAFAVGRNVKDTLARRMPLNAVGLPDLTLSAGASLSGSVTDSAVAVPYAQVNLYRRGLGILVDQQRCTATGAFAFTGLPTSNPGDYFVVAFDPPGGAVNNALVLDYLTPA